MIEQFAPAVPVVAAVLGAAAWLHNSLGAHPHGQAHGIEGVYDLEIVSPGGVVERAFQGTFSVLPEVTR